MSKASKTKGKKGESNARAILEREGWYFADSETQGLAGDDLFARDPNGKWWSIEIKNTAHWNPAYVYQAQRQAKERWFAINKEISAGSQDGEVYKFLGMHEFRQTHWLVLWHPSNNRCTGDLWVGVRQKEGKHLNEFVAPFPSGFHSTEPTDESDI